MDYNPALIALSERQEIPIETLYRVIYKDEVHLLDQDTLFRVNTDMLDEGQGVFTCTISPGLIPGYRAFVIGDYIGLIVRGAEHQAKSRGCTLRYHIVNREIGTSDYFRSLLRTYPEAGLLSITAWDSGELIETCKEMQRPCVLIDYQGDDDPEAYTVSINNRKAIVDAMDHLFDLGHTRIGFITGNLSLASARERLQGYEDAVGEAYDPNLIVQGSWSIESAEAVTCDLLNAQSTAIVASNDLMAIGAMMAARSAGLQVPDDISIIGFDNIPMAENVLPALTTIEQPMNQIGEAAADTLIELLEGGQPSIQHHKLETNLIIRQSTGPCSR
jgi:LacI family transcriptional regulator